MRYTIGTKINRWTVLKDLGVKDHRRWLDCLCECGTKRKIRADMLNGGLSKSCGCLRTENHIVSVTKHGYTSRRNGASRTYESWHSMHQRCTNKNHTGYKKYYGGRGITICRDWKKFVNFVRDMGERPEGKTLDRINTNGNYCKENCRWATPKEQSNNMRNNIASKKLVELFP